jgi:cyanophycin synthetase
MKIESTRAFTGANVYSHQPVLLMRLDLEELKGKESCEISGFNAQLLELLPRLSEHFCDSGSPRRFCRTNAQRNAF